MAFELELQYLKSKSRFRTGKIWTYVWEQTVSEIFCNKSSIVDPNPVGSVAGSGSGKINSDPDSSVSKIKLK